MARNKKRIYNKHKTKETNNVTIRLNRQDFLIWEKAKKKNNMSQWFRRKLRSDFTNILTETDYIEEKKKDLFSLQRERDKTLHSFEEEIRLLVEHIRRLKEQQEATYEYKN